MYKGNHNDDQLLVSYTHKISKIYGVREISIHSSSYKYFTDDVILTQQSLKKI